MNSLIIYYIAVALFCALAIYVSAWTIRKCRSITAPNVKEINHLTYGEYLESDHEEYFPDLDDAVYKNE